MPNIKLESDLRNYIEKYEKSKAELQLMADLAKGEQSIRKMTGFQKLM